MNELRPPPPLVLAAPSGTGKTTIAHALVQGPGRFVFSVSATTREPRRGEQEGVDYLFVTRKRFLEMAANDELAEWAAVHDQYYGTPIANLREAAGRGDHVILDIDVQGARQIRKRLPEAVLVFILPPSVDALVARLRGRGTEDGAQIRRRLRTAREELEAVPEFDHVVVNRDLEHAIDEVRALAKGNSAPRPLNIKGITEKLINDIDRFLAPDTRPSKTVDANENRGDS